MIEHLTIEEWTAFDRACPAPTGFARPYWSLALAEAYPHLVADPVRMVRPGARPLVVALVRHRRGMLPWRIWYGSYAGSYTCFLRDDGTCASPDETVAGIEELMRECEACEITPWPLAFPTASLGILLGRKSVRQVSHETSVVSLRHCAENVSDPIERNRQRMARQAARRRVVCTVEYGASAVSEYYRMLEESAARWGVDEPTIPRRLLEGCVRLGGDDVEIWFARIPDTPDPIAGCVALYGSRELFGWSLVMRRDYSRLRPSNALYIAQLERASQRGLEWLNLGASEGLPGVEHFKESLGARSMPYISAHYEHRRRTTWKRLRGLVPFLPF